MEFSSDDSHVPSHVPMCIYISKREIIVHIVTLVEPFDILFLRRIQKEVVVFNSSFIDISVISWVSFICGGNQSTRRKKEYQNANSLVLNTPTKNLYRLSMKMPTILTIWMYNYLFFHHTGYYDCQQYEQNVV